MVSLARNNPALTHVEQFKYIMLSKKDEESHHLGNILSLIIAMLLASMRVAVCQQMHKLVDTN